MKTLEIVAVTSFIAGVCLAECIPLCAVCFAVFFGCGFVLERGLK